MARKKVTKNEETIYSEDEVASEGGSNGSVATTKHDDGDTLDIEKQEAIKSKYRFIAERNRIELEKLQKQVDSAKNGGNEDEVEKLNAQLLKSMRMQVTMKQLSKMLEDGDEKKGGLRDELSEGLRYLERKIEDGNKAKGGTSDTMMMMQMMMQQSQQSMQMMIAMMNRQDPNAAINQQIMMKVMDSRASIKDFLPMIIETQKMQQMMQGNMDETRMEMMKEVMMHALSAGEKDWGSMSAMEKYEFIMGAAGKTIDAAVTKVKSLAGAARSFKKHDALPGKKEPQKLGLVKEQPKKTDQGVNQPVVDQGANQQEGAPTDEQIAALVNARVKQILTVVESEMKLGSDPFVVYDEIERLYFGLPKALREKISEEPNPMNLVTLLEPHADKAQLDRIVAAAMASADNADWLKEFHEALCGIFPEDEDEEEEDGEDNEGDGDDQGEEGDTDKDEAPPADGGEADSGNGVGGPK